GKHLDHVTRRRASVRLRHVAHRPHTVREGIMHTSTPFAGVLGLLTMGLFVASCRDSTDPARQDSGAPALAIVTGAHPAMDQFNGTLSESGTSLLKGFNPTNPHLGSAIIAT